LLARDLPLDAAAAELGAELPLVGPALPPRAGCINVAVSEALAALHDAPAGSLLMLPLSLAGGSGAGSPPTGAVAPPTKDGDGGTRAREGATAGRGSNAPMATPATPSTSGATADRPCAAPAAGHVQVYVRAVWRDYARQQGALVMDRRDWLRLGGDALANDLAIWLDEGADPVRVQDQLRTLAARLARAGADGTVPGNTAAAGDPAAALDDEQLSGLEFGTPGEIRALSLSIFDRSFVVTRWLQVVAIALGLVGVAASFSAQVLARRKEFGALQHLGVTRRQLLLLVAGEGALWCGLGALLGLVLGLVISVVLVDVVNPQSFHWTMDLALPVGRLAALVGAVLLAGAAAATLAGRAAASRQMALAVKEDW
jgi:putative ABC transport system permease protein